MTDLSAEAEDDRLIADFVDIDRYPIHRAGASRFQRLIARCQQMMADDSICALPGFLHDKAVRRLAREITGLEPVARRVNYVATPYGWMDNQGFPPRHPRSRLFRRHCGVITADQFSASGPSVALFQCNHLTDFVRLLLGYDTLYRSACPNISIRVNMMQQGDEFGWHFDTNDGVVSFIIQNADHGGIFEYQPLVRSEQDENYTGVDGIFSGSIPPKRADLAPGTFVLFMGRRSVHRVSEVGNTRHCRHSLLFSYDRKPGMVFPEHIRRRLTEPSAEPFLGAAGRRTS